MFEQSIAIAGREDALRNCSLDAMMSATEKLVEIGGYRLEPRVNGDSR